MKELNQSICEMVPVSIGFVIYILVRITYGPINFQTEPGYCSLILGLISFLSFTSLAVGKKRMPKTARIRLSLSGSILSIATVFLAYKSLT